MTSTHSLITNCHCDSPSKSALVMTLLEVATSSAADGSLATISATNGDDWDRRSRSLNFCFGTMSVGIFFSMPPSGLVSGHRIELTSCWSLVGSSIMIITDHNETLWEFNHHTDYSKHRLHASLALRCTDPHMTPSNASNITQDDVFVNKHCFWNQYPGSSAEPILY